MLQGIFTILLQFKCVVNTAKTALSASIVSSASVRSMTLTEGGNNIISVYYSYGHSLFNACCKVSLRAVSNMLFAYTFREAALAAACNFWFGLIYQVTSSDLRREMFFTFDRRRLSDPTHVMWTPP
ncbi:hypothetical protein ACLECX_04145 [Lonsdalea quercina]|uniref:hypothetical protein n=1 Tax=Lonsdalea quercina TaxID=71657 RepID=UPI003976F4F5